jgi:hypothetical protein
MFIARQKNTVETHYNSSTIEEFLKPEVTVAYVDSPAILAEIDPKHTANQYACHKTSHQRQQSTSTQ